VASALASQQNMMDLEKLKALVPMGGSLNGMPLHLVAALSSFSQNSLNGKQGAPQGGMAQPPRLKVHSSCKRNRLRLGQPHPSGFPSGPFLL